MTKKFEDIMQQLATVSEQQKESKLDKSWKEFKAKLDKPRVMNLPRFALDTFRYSLTFLMFSVKLGLFTYLETNPLADVSWFIVFLPALFIEIGLIGFLLVVAIAAVVFGIFGLIYAAVTSFIESRKRKSEIKLPDSGLGKEW